MLDARLSLIREKAASRAYRIYREDYDFAGMAEDFAARDVPLMMRSALRLQRLLETEKAVILPEDRIGLVRTVRKVPSMLTQDEWARAEANHWVFDGGKVINISSNYAGMIHDGFGKRREMVLARLETAKAEGDEEGVLFLEAALVCLDACTVFARKYAAEARRQGKEDMAQVFENIATKGASSFHEACQFFRLLNFLLWINDNHHITVGRFDQYMYPYYRHDVEAGILTREEAYALLTETFLSLNKDSELYHGVQQGDNGQSLVLGGVKPDGTDGVNELTSLCLRASLDINLIDPKINLRVDKNTPLSLYMEGTELTKQGMGFPQYSNDDVVIPGLVSLGYDLEDARDYVMAACWEFIVPGKGMDIPNIDAMNFPQVLSDTVRKDLAACTTFDAFLDRYKERMAAEAVRILAQTQSMFVQPAPMQSLLMDGCIERARDISTGGKYNNYGIHGAGIATAVDGLSAIRQNVYTDKSVSSEALIGALDSDYADESIRLKMLDAPRMGNNDDRADALAVWLLDAFADVLAPLRNERGGIIRPGTGTAMYYLWSAESAGATPDGRHAGESFSANYSPSITTRPDGPLSVLQSFAKPHLSRVINGGPLTLELHDTVFRNTEGMQKVAMLVRAFIQLGGHQLQLNAINRETLLDAQANPEKYRNLIVRVWGWSGYFVELDKTYQDHIISRVEF